MDPKNKLHGDYVGHPTWTAEGATFYMELRKYAVPKKNVSDHAFKVGMLVTDSASGTLFLIRKLLVNAHSRSGNRGWRCAIVQRMACDDPAATECVPEQGVFCQINLPALEPTESALARHVTPLHASGLSAWEATLHCISNHAGKFKRGATRRTAGRGARKSAGTSSGEESSAGSRSLGGKRKAAGQNTSKSKAVVVVVSEDDSSSGSEPADSDDESDRAESDTTEDTKRHGPKRQKVAQSKSDLAADLVKLNKPVLVDRCVQLAADLTAEREALSASSAVQQTVIEKLSAEHSASLNERAADRSAATAKLVAEHSTAASELRAETSRVRAELQVLQGANATMVADAQRNVSSYMTLEKDNAALKESDKWLRYNLDAKTAEVLALNSGAQARTESMKDVWQLRVDLKTVEGRLKNVEAERVAAVSQSTSMAVELATLRTTTETKLEKLRTANETKLAKLTVDHATELATLRTASETKLATLTSAGNLSLQGQVDHERMVAEAERVRASTERSESLKAEAERAERSDKSVTGAQQSMVAALGQLTGLFHRPQATTTWTGAGNAPTPHAGTSAIEHKPQLVGKNA